MNNDKEITMLEIDDLKKISEEEQIQISKVKGENMNKNYTQRINAVTKELFFWKIISALAICLASFSVFSVSSAENIGILELISSFALLLIALLFNSFLGADNPLTRVTQALSEKVVDSATKRIKFK